MLQLHREAVRDATTNTGLTEATESETRRLRAENAGACCLLTSVAISTADTDTKWRRDVTRLFLMLH